MPHVSESCFRVRYAETDQMGVVYYANYFVWMEIGRTDYCRSCGFSYHDLEKETKAFIAVAEANCRYLSSARYDDEIIVETRMTRLRSRALEFTYTIRNGRGVVAAGRTLHVVVGPEGRPKALPPHYLELMRKQLEDEPPSLPMNSNTG